MTKKKRKPIKTVSQKAEKFIPKEYEGMDEKAESIYDRPLIFEGKKTTREQRFGLQDQMDAIYPDGVDPTKVKPKDLAKVIKVVGKGDAFKYVFDNCITKIYNVILQKEDGTVEEINELEETSRFWNTEGCDSELAQAVTFFMNESGFSEAESKN